MAPDDQRKIILYGASYPDTLKLLGRLHAELLQDRVHGFVDDIKRDGAFMGFPILGTRDILQKLDPKDYVFVNNVFSTPQSRYEIGSLLDKYQFEVLSLIDPDVDMGYAKAGKGTVIMKGAQIGSNVQMGDYCTIRMNSVVNHDNSLGDFVFIGPGATLCGYVTIDSFAYIGAGSVIRERIHIGAHAIVGAGSVVTKDVAEHITVKGNPAKGIGE